MPRALFLPPSTGLQAQSGDNADANLSAAYDPNTAWYITLIGWSYSAAPPNGRLFLSDDISGVLLIDLDIRASGHGFVPLPSGGLKLGPGPVTQGYLIRLVASGTAGVVGKLTVMRYRR
jgi:hypothetical protein